MGNINSVFIEGNLTKAAELSRWSNGTPYCKFNIAHNESYKDDAGNWVDIPSFFDCVIKGNYAEAMYKHLFKGRWVLVEAHLKQNRWKDNEGVNHYAVNLVVENLRFAPGSFQSKENQEEQQQSFNNPAPSDEQYNYDENYTDSEIPF